MAAGHRRHFAAEIAGRFVDAFTERKADETGDLDRPADLAFGFLDGLRYRLLAFFNGIALIEQAHFLVESFETGLDNLLNDVRWLTDGLCRDNTFFALDSRRIQTGRVNRLWIGCSHMHREQTAERFQFVGISG